MNAFIERIHFKWQNSIIHIPSDKGHQRIIKENKNFTQHFDIVCDFIEVNEITKKKNKMYQQYLNQAQSSINNLSSDELKELLNDDEKLEVHVNDAVSGLRILRFFLVGQYCNTQYSINGLFRYASVGLELHNLTKLTITSICLCFPVERFRRGKRTNFSIELCARSGKCRQRTRNHWEKESNKWTGRRG